MNKRVSQCGVTLLELLIVIAVAAVLAVIGMPSMTDYVHTTQLNSAKNRITADLNLARGEAIKRNNRVLVCASNANHTDCNTVVDWAADGWLVCTDSTNDAVDNCDVTSTTAPNPIQVTNVSGKLIKVTGPATAIRFNPIGSQGAPGNAGVSVTVFGTWNTAITKTITVVGTGNVSSN